MAELKKYEFDNFVVGKKKADPVREEKTEESKTITKESIEEAKEVETHYEQASEEISMLPDELEEKLKAAEAKGFEKGRKSAFCEGDAVLTGVMIEINNHLKEITEDECKLQKDAEDKFVAMSKALLTQIIPSLTKEHAADIVNSFLNDNFKNFKKEAKLSFYLNPNTISSVQENISKLANINDFEGKISLHKDDNLGPSDCRIEWEDGGVECSISGLLNKVNNLLENTGDQK